MLSLTGVTLADWLGPVLALGGGLVSAGAAYIIARQKGRADAEALGEQLRVQREEIERRIRDIRSERKLDIAYKYAELLEKNEETAATFLHEVSKETAIGFLYWEEGEFKAKIWVRNDANILIGRSDTCDVRIDNRFVSREHCVIHTSDEVASIVPLNPTNKVRVNGEEIECRTALSDGAEIMIADDRFVYFKF